MFTAFPRTTPRWTGVALLHGAILLSVLLHVVLIRYSPSFRFGSMRESIRAADLPPLRLEEVISEPPPSYPELEKLIPTDPNRVADIPRELENLTPELPTESAGDLPDLTDLPTPQTTTEAPVDLSTREVNYDPRQEILAIQDEVLAEEVATLPRQFTPVIPRTNYALDIIEPVEVSVADLARVVASANAPTNSGTSPSTIGGLPSLERRPAPPDIELPPPVELPGEEKMVEASTLADEPLEELSEHKPVEDLLGIQAFVFSDPADAGALFFRINIFRKGIERLPVIPKDFIFMIDASQSMSAALIRKCKEGLIQALPLLREEDSFNIMAFREDVEFAFPEFMRASVVNKARARSYIEQLTSRGRTDVFESLKQLSLLPRQANRPLIALLVTDGRPTMGLTDSSDIIEGFTQVNQGGISVFAVGGGQRVNKYLLDLLSYRNRGDSLLVPFNEDVPNALERSTRELRHPVLTDLRYRFSGMDESQVFPRGLTHLYIDRPLVLYGRVLKRSGPLAFQVVGKSHDASHDMVFQLDLDNALVGDSSIRQEWAHHMVYHLIGQYIETRDPELMQRLIRECATYKINVPYAYQLDSPVQR